MEKSKFKILFGSDLGETISYREILDKSIDEAKKSYLIPQGKGRINIDKEIDDNNLYYIKKSIISHCYKNSQSSNEIFWRIKKNDNLIFIEFFNWDELKRTICYNAKIPMHDNDFANDLFMELLVHKDWYQY